VPMELMAGKSRSFRFRIFKGFLKTLKSGKVQNLGFCV